MGIFIKNPETEQRVRRLAALRGQTITGAIDHLAREALDREQISAARPTIQEMKEATGEFRKAIGLDKRRVVMTKDDYDALWEIPEIAARAHDG